MVESAEAVKAVDEDLEQFCEKGMSGTLQFLPFRQKNNSYGGLFNIKS